MSGDDWLESFDPASEATADDELRLGLRAALDPGHAEASSESLDEAIEAMFDSMDAEQAENVAGAMRAIGRQASRAGSNPIAAQAARAGLPAAGGALGSFGGPLGTAAGMRLGTAVGRSVGGPKVQSAKPGATRAVAADPMVGQGSQAAARALILTQHPRVLQSLLALALGEQGTKTVDDVPVERVMRVLRAVFVQAEADAGALARPTGASVAPNQVPTPSEDEDSALYAGVGGSAERLSRDWLDW